MGDAAVLDAATAEQLNNAETRRLLDTIDSLRDLSIAGIGIVDLPQIIVVGDQCSGKSSVLEAISRVHFPVSDGICTRFATELVLRRAPKESTDLRIRYAAGADTDADADIYSDADTKSSPTPARTPFHESGFQRSELPAIINRAKEHMGLADGKTTSFSKHVLRVEISGPDIPSLTLVDLPGIFHSGSSSQPQEWKAVVDEMVEGYMRQKNSIILMVVSADISLSKHAILDMALQHDTARERTIGVITKVDLCPGSNLEDEYLRLARGQEPSHELRPGWHVLRNRGPREVEVDFDQRDAEEEKFLSTGAWSTLPSANRGVDSLRKSLGVALLKQIKSSLPELIRDIEGNLQNRQRRLAKLGTTRTNSDEMRDYLLTISTTFHRLAEHAVEGRYNDPFFTSPADQESSNKVRFRKLRSLLRNFNYAFDLTMRTNGAKYKMDWDEKQSGDNTHHGLTAEETLIDALEDAPYSLNPILDLYDFPDPIEEGKDEAFNRIEQLASESQGAEFSGLPSNDFVMQLFRDQSEPWRRIAECHIDNVMERARLFVYQVFDYILEDDERTRDAILAECVDTSFDSFAVALKDKLDEIMRPYTSGHGLPLEIDFRAGVWRRKLRRMKADSTELLDKNSVAYNTSEYRMLKPEDVLNVLIQADSRSYSHFGIDVSVDMMLTHYQMSLRTFTDNVVHLVLENCLVSKLPDIFCARVVTQMSDETLQRLAEESDEVKLERVQLADEVEKLKKGLQHCQRSRPRDFSDLPDAFVEAAPRRFTPRADGSETDAPKADETKRKIRVKLPPVSLPARKASPFKPNVGQTSTTTEPVTASTSLTTAELNRNPPGQTPAVASSSSTATVAPSTLPFGLVRESAPKSSIFGSTPASTTTSATTASTIVGSEPSNKASTATATVKPATPSAFGTIPAPSTTPSAFGSVPAAQSSTSPFGRFPAAAFGSVPAPQTPASAFGSVSPVPTQSSTPAFGSVSALKSPLPVFGSVSAMQSFAAKLPVFGSTTSAAAATSTTSAFGSTIAASTSSQSPFGSLKPAATSDSPSAIRSFFGSKPAAENTTAPAPSSLNLRPTESKPAFGTSAFDDMSGLCPPNTAIAAFQPLLQKEVYPAWQLLPGDSDTVTLAYQTLEFQNCYMRWSIDELRLADYHKGRRPPAKLMGPFGSAPPSQPEGPGGTSVGTTSPPPPAVARPVGDTPLIHF